MDKPFSLEDYGINQAGNVAIQDALAEHVRCRFDRAVRHKRQIGMEARLLRNLRANKCEYQPEELSLLQPGNNVYMGICALKARAAESWLTDIILNNIEKPWTISPTPKPDLPEEQTERVVDMLLREITNLHSVEALKDRAKQLKSAHSKIAFQEAEHAVGRMENLMDDQLSEGDWTETFTAFIAELVAYPTALIRGPIVVGRTVGAWDGNEYGAKDVSLPVTRLVSAFDAFPSPDSKTTQDGEFFCERVKYNPGKLYSLIGVDGFNSGNIRQVLDSYPDGYEYSLPGDAERESLEGTSDTDTVVEGTDDGRYETIIYNGQVPGKLLAEHGVIVKDQQKAYECEVWQIGDYVIRAILNPNPSGRRPIYSTSYRKITGSFWGNSVIDLVYDVGRVCNASARAIVRNAAYSSGPIGEVVAERVSETQDPTEIEPYVIKMVGPDLSGTGAPAYRFTKIASVAGELIALFNQFMKYADDLSGVPSYVLGNPQVAGAGRTLGGLSMLMGNAAKGIKTVQLNVDQDVIAKVVEGYYVYNMITSDDMSIKADAKVVARGATGLLQRELAQTRTIEILQLLTPYIERWNELPDGIKIMLREILKTTGLPIDDIIPDPNSERGTMDLLNLIGAQGGGVPGDVAPGGQAVALNRGTSAPVPLPPQSMPPAGPLQAGPVAVNMPQGA